MEEEILNTVCFTNVFIFHHGHHEERGCNPVNDERVLVPVSSSCSTRLCLRLPPLQPERRTARPEDRSLQPPAVETRHNDRNCFHYGWDVGPTLQFRVKKHSNYLIDHHSLFLDLYECCSETDWQTTNPSDELRKEQLPVSEWWRKRPAQRVKTRLSETQKIHYWLFYWQLFYD